MISPKLALSFQKLPMPVLARKSKKRGNLMPVDGNGKFQLSGLRKGSDGKLPIWKASPKSPKVESPEVKMHEGDEGGMKHVTVHEKW